MANVATIVAALRICPDVVTPVVDRQMLEITIRDLVGIPEADRLTGNNSLWIAFDQMGIRSFLGDLITLTEDDIMNLTARPTRVFHIPNLFRSCTNAGRSSSLLRTTTSLG